MEIIKPKFYPHFSTPTYCLCVNDHFVYRFHHASKTLSKHFQIPPKNTSLIGQLKDTIARSWLKRKYSNAMGLGHVVELPSGTSVVIYDKVYRFNPQEHKKYAQPTYTLSADGALPPLRNGICINPTTGDAYFAEYANDLSRPTDVYRITNDGRKVEHCHQFTAQEIKHVHGIFWDKFRQRIWITTGDTNEQSWFYYTDDNFKSVHRFKGGDQSWRAVALIITENALVWGMDAGKDATASDINYIYHYDLTTGVRTQVQQIDSPAYHMTRTASGKMILTTNYEPGCLQPIAPEAAIWVSDQGLTWQKVAQFDYLPTPNVSGSKYAYIYPPMGVVPDDSYLFTTTNTQDAPMVMRRLSVEA